MLAFCLRFNRKVNDLLVVLQTAGEFQPRCSQSPKSVVESRTQSQPDPRLSSVALWPPERWPCACRSVLKSRGGVTLLSCRKDHNYIGAWSSNQHQHHCTENYKAPCIDQLTYTQATVHPEPMKKDTIVLPISSLNTDRFKTLYWHSL